MEIQDRRRRYEWGSGNPDLVGLPGYIAAQADSSALPRDAQFDDEKAQEVAWKKALGAGNLGK